MTTKHTPGEWRVDETVGLGAYGVWSDDKQICRVRLGSDAAISREERDANAKLIAAAPDMLAVIKSALAIQDLWLIHECSEEHRDEAAALSQMKQQFESAIAKAAQ